VASAAEAAAKAGLAAGLSKESAAELAAEIAGRVAAQQANSAEQEPYDTETALARGVALAALPSGLQEVQLAEISTRVASNATAQQAASKAGKTDGRVTNVRRHIRSTVELVGRTADTFALAGAAKVQAVSQPLVSNLEVSIQTLQDQIDALGKSAEVLALRGRPDPVSVELGMQQAQMLDRIAMKAALQGWQAALEGWRANASLTARPHPSTRASSSQDDSDRPTSAPWTSFTQRPAQQPSLLYGTQLLPPRPVLPGDAGWRDVVAEIGMSASIVPAPSLRQLSDVQAAKDNVLVVHSDGFSSTFQRQEPSQGYQELQAISTANFGESLPEGADETY